MNHHDTSPKKVNNLSFFMAHGKAVLLQVSGRVIASVSISAMPTDRCGNLDPCNTGTIKPRQHMPQSSGLNSHQTKVTDLKNTSKYVPRNPTCQANRNQEYSQKKGWRFCQSGAPMAG